MHDMSRKQLHAPAVGLGHFGLLPNFFLQSMGCNACSSDADRQLISKTLLPRTEILLKNSCILNTPSSTHTPTSNTPQLTDLSTPTSLSWARAPIDDNTAVANPRATILWTMLHCSPVRAQLQCCPQRPNNTATPLSQHSKPSHISVY